MPGLLLLELFNSSKPVAFSFLGLAHFLVLTFRPISSLADSLYSGSMFESKRQLVFEQRRP
jgi:hypothetical protein